MGRFEESNRRTAEVFLHREDGVLFRDPVKYPKKNPASLMKEKDRLLICAEVMDMMNKDIRKLQAQLKAANTPSWKEIMRMAGRRIRGSGSRE